MKLRIGTRGSPLALRQAEEVKDLLLQLHPGLEVKLVKIRTTGDKITEAPLATIGSKGIFVKEIEEALLRGEIDLAVHSMKDLPTRLPPGLTIGAVPPREDPRDALVSRDGRYLHELSPGVKIGTSSLRRRVQLLRIKASWQIVPLRGNLDTRLRKLREGEVEAIVVASAGLRRLGLQHQARQLLPPELLLPAAGQGALAVECREGDGVMELLGPLNHPQTALEVRAERAFLERMGGGCQVPMGALARSVQGQVRLRGMVSSLDGRRFFVGEEEGLGAEEVGRRLAERLLREGAEKVLEEIYAEGEG